METVLPSRRLKVIVTICSKHKDSRAELLPASERYTGNHISKAKEIAAQQSLPLFILSGSFGLIPAETLIPFYDYYLEESAVDSLAELVAEQIQQEEITEIDFYTEHKESWLPYEKALQKATELTKVPLVPYQLY